MSYKTYEVRVYDNGNKYWYLDGKYHREDGPAVERTDGGKEWYLNGKLHREDGPAAELADGNKYWYLNDKLLSEKEWRKQVDQDSYNEKVIKIEGRKYKLQLEN
jgi:hypothetical protein